MNNFATKSIIITGASSGIGRKLALELAKEKASLLLVARSEEALREVANACQAMGAQATAFTADVSREEECKKVIEKSIELYGKLDILINNAGRSMYARLEDVKDLSILESLMKVNYFSAVYCTYYALPHLKKSQGQIVSLSSITGLIGTPTRTGYAGSKHAVHGFFDSLRPELTQYGINVLVIAPGYVSTGIRERAFNAQGDMCGSSAYSAEKEAISLSVLVKNIISAMQKRKREVILPHKLKFALLAKLLFPTLLEWFTTKMVFKNYKLP